MNNVSHILVSVLATTAAVLDDIAPDIAKFGTIQQRPEGRSTRALRVLVHRDRAHALYATLGYMKRQKQIISVRSLEPEDLDE